MLFRTCRVLVFATQGCAKQQSRDTAYIYIIASMAVDTLDEAGALTFGSTENFWEVTIHRKKIKKCFMSVLPREIYHPGPFLRTEMRNGQNRESENRRSGCSGGLRSFRNDPSECPGWVRVPQNDWSCPNPNSRNR